MKIRQVRQVEQHHHRSDWLVSHHIEWGRFSHSHPVFHNRMVPPRVSNLHDDCKARNNDAVKCLLQIYVCKPKREIPFQRPAANIFQYHKSIFYISAWSESNLIFGLMLLQCWPRSLPNQCQYKNSPNAWKPTITTAPRNYIARKTQLMLKTV